MDFATVAAVLAKQFGDQAVAQIDALKKKAQADKAVSGAIATSVDSEVFNETASKVAVQPTGKILSEQA